MKRRTFLKSSAAIAVPYFVPPSVFGAGAPSNRINERGMRALAASAAVRAIPFVLLGGNPGDPSEQLSLDWDGSIASSWLPDLGRELEAAHGTIAWLYPASPADRPDRYHASR